MLILKIKTFLKSLWFHIAAGLPKSTEQEIYDRYTVCINCEKFKPLKEECGVCGCNITNKSVFLNKLAWADQECPIGKWSKIHR
jgi:hypothetical protein